jgi:hypothetical protein
MPRKAGQWENVQDKAPKSEKKQENPAKSRTVGKYGGWKLCHPGSL